MDSSRFKQRNSEVLPDPEGPSTTRISPRASSNVTLLRMGFSRLNEMLDTVSISKLGNLTGLTGWRLGINLTFEKTFALAHKEK